MAVLVLVLAVLTVSYASSFRTYLQQRAAINATKAENARTVASMTTLSAQNKRLHDPFYASQLARGELGYVAPGQTLYVVSKDGKPLGTETPLTSPAKVGAKKVPPGWWSGVWDSVESAGDPPPAQPVTTPATTIHGSTGN